MRRRVSARRSSKEEASNYAALIKAFRASLSFLCLLGITWVFGALAIGKAAVVFIYLFAILQCAPRRGHFHLPLLSRSKVWLSRNQIIDKDSIASEHDSRHLWAQALGQSITNQHRNC
jgi:hypothetical protein